MRWTAVLLASCALGAAVAAAEPPPLRVEAAGDMQVLVSLPRGWSKARSWPIVVVVEAAEKQFEVNARRFAAARGDLPFIIVAPFAVTNGRQGQGDPRIYPYGAATWRRIERDGVCAFDVDGVLRAVDVVRRRYGGEERFFVTGFEAGAHLVWALVFRHPERLRGAAPVAGNYIGRCVEDAALSTHAARRELPVRGFVGDADELCGPRGKLHGQWEAARALALAHGWGRVDETVVPGKGHVPMPAEVLAYFASLR